MSAQPERQQQDPNEALRARLEQLSPEQRRVVAERIATLRQQLRNASPGVLAQLRERLQPSPPQEVRVGPPGVITTTSATVATPDVAAPEAGKLELDALESAIKAEPQDEETIKAALATRNKARLERLRRGNNNMTRWNSFFEKRLDAIGKAIKPAEDILEDNIGIIDKPAKAPPAAFDATPTAQEATKPAAAALVPEQKPAGGLTLTFRNVPTFTKALGLQRALQTLDGVHEARAVGFEKGVLSITLDYDPAKVQSINEAIRELLNEKRKYESWDVQASRVEEEQT